MFAGSPLLPKKRPGQRVDLSITFFLSPKSVRAFPNYEKLSATQRTMSLIRLLWFWWERKTIGNAAKQKTKLYAHCRKITQMQMQMMWKFISLVLFAQRIGRQPTKKKHFDYDTCMVCVTGACDMFRCPLNVSGAFFFVGVCALNTFLSFACVCTCRPQCVWVCMLGCGMRRQ